MSFPQSINTALTAHRPLPPFARIAFNVTLVILAWEERRVGRRNLGKLDPHLLQDIGLSMQDAETEATKPFWRA